MRGRADAEAKAGSRIHASAATAPSRPGSGAGRGRGRPPLLCSALLGSARPRRPCLCAARRAPAGLHLASPRPCFARLRPPTLPPRGSAGQPALALLRGFPASSPPHRRSTPPRPAAPGAGYSRPPPPAAVSPRCGCRPELPRRRGWRGRQRPCEPEAEGRVRRRRGRRRERRRRRDEALPAWGRAAALAAVGGEVGRGGSAALPGGGCGSPAFTPRGPPSVATWNCAAGGGELQPAPRRGPCAGGDLFWVNVFAGTALAPRAVRGQECGGAAGPGWASPGAAAGAVVTGVRGGRARRVSAVLLLEQRKIIRGVMEQSNTGPIRRGTSCWKLPIPSRVADCPGDVKPAPVSKG